MLKKIGAEPVVFLYVFVLYFSKSIEIEWFTQTTCRINLQYPVDICSNLFNISLTNSNPYYRRIDSIVQKSTNTFLVYRDWGGQFFPMLLAIFIGEWSDKYGRKIPLIVGLMGKLYYCLAVVVISALQLPLEYILYGAIIPASLTGLDMAVLISTFAYTSDVTHKSKKTLRFALLEACTITAMAMGVFASTLYFTLFPNRHYSFVFGINCILLLIAISYSCLNLKPFTLEYHKTNVLNVSPWEKIQDFFCVNYQNLRTIFVIKYSATTNRRYSRSRRFILMFALAITLFVFPNVEYRVRGPESTPPLFYEVYTIYKLVATSLLLPMTQFLGLGDISVCILITFIGIFAHLGYLMASSLFDLYLVGALTSVCTLGPPVIRSISSKIAEEEHLGKVFALLTLCETLAPIGSLPIYAWVYSLHPKLVHLLTCACLSLVLTLLCLTLIAMPQINTNRGNNTNPCMVPNAHHDDTETIQFSTINDGISYAVPRREWAADTPPPTPQYSSNASKVVSIHASNLDKIYSLSNCSSSNSSKDWKRHSFPHVYAAHPYELNSKYDAPKETSTWPKAFSLLPIKNST